MNLKPCPFCGSANVHAYTYKEAVYRQYAVKCKKCGARIMAQSTESAIEKWNRRAETTTEMLMRVLAYDATCGACDKRKERTAKVIDKSVGRHWISDFEQNNGGKQDE